MIYLETTGTENKGHGLFFYIRWFHFLLIGVFMAVRHWLNETLKASAGSNEPIMFTLGL